MGDMADMILDEWMCGHWDDARDGDEDDGINPFGNRSLYARNSRPCRCRLCNKVITFSLNPKGNFVPVNKDGSGHSCQARATKQDFPPI